MPLVPQAHVVHRTAERVRIKVPDRRRDRAFFVNAADELAGLAGVARVEANPLTGSLLIQFAGDGDRVVEQAVERELFRLTDVREGEMLLLKRVRGEFSGLHRWIRTATDGEVDLRALAFLALGGMGVVQLLRGNITAPAATLLWYAASLAVGDLAVSDADSERGGSTQGDILPGPAESRG